MQVGRLYRGRDDDGNEVHDPIYAYDMEGINKSLEPHLNARLSMCGFGPGAEERKQKVRDNYGEHCANLADELKRLSIERKAMEDAAGLTAALEAARETSAKVKEIEAQIIGFIPESLADVAAVAAWTIKGMSEDADGYLDDEAPLRVLASFGKSVSK